MLKEIIVGPFSSHLTRNEKEEFLLHFGAVKVSHVFKKNKEKYAIARFEDTKTLDYALKRIHQVELFGRRISAKYYDDRKLLRPTPEASFCRKTDSQEINNKLRASLFNYEAQLSGISAKFGIHNPISPKLKYAYPEPSPSVLCNIAHALVAVPKFYTQVLHLMNKMNLPCPFGPLTGEPPMMKEAKTMSKAFRTYNDKNENEKTENIINSFTEEDNQHQENGTETESELESDEEIKSMFNKEKQQPKRVMISRKKRINKKPKLEILKQSLLAPKDSTVLEPKDDSLALQRIFEMPNLNTKRTLNVNVQSAVLGHEDCSKEVVTEGFGKIYPQSKNLKNEESKESSQFISIEELSTNRIPETDWPIVPVFKNYKTGSPSTRLYIKNLAKTVTEYDLRFIFGRFIPPVEEENAEESIRLNVRLMKEGRMKGQAFVTFPLENMAVKALQEVNGYILKDKPMVIVFGKVKSTE